MPRDEKTAGAEFKKGKSEKRRKRETAKKEAEIAEIKRTG